MTALMMLCPVCALADDSGALAEGELNDWVVGVLRKSAGRQPLNAPVGEESLTEDGYAFIFDFATLYYDKPVLDENSVLTGVSVTSERWPGPREICLGDGQSLLMDTYGWENPTLEGDGTLAALYCIDGLPQSAYWCWAQHDGSGQIASVQCAIHVRVAEDRYTDAGVTYLLDGGTVSAIRVYGLNSFVTEEEVRGNMEAVAGVQAGNAPAVAVSAATAPASDAAPFGTQDLSFSGLDYAALTPEAAKAVLGEPSGQTSARDESGATYLNLTWPGAELVWLDDAQGGGAQSLRVTDGSLTGPRGLKTGMAFEEAAALFLSEGGQGLLYGEPGASDYAEAVNEGAQTILTYHTAAGATGYALQLVFENGALREWVLSTADAR